MKRAIILFGSNLGDRRESLAFALNALASSLGNHEKISPLYETASWGKEGLPDYLNCVMGYNTSLSAKEILELLLSTEQKAGRVRGDEKYASRTIDLDLLLLEEMIIHEEGLIVPHPRMHLRRFTLQPLADIYPDVTHPILNKNISILLKECKDPSEVKYAGQAI